MTFNDLNLIEPIKKSLADENYEVPTPIQAEAIPYILDGYDLLGCAQTGTGKTAAFSIPIIQHLYNNPTRGIAKIRALVLTPTRELAIQINDSFAAYSSHTSLRHTVIFGGVKQRAQTDALEAGVDILVATPGRLLDLISQRYISLSDIEYFVLDEADRMLDMGFIHDIKRLLPMLPKRRQSLFFSATMPAQIEALASSILTDPKKVEVTPVSSTVDKIEQYLCYVDKKEKPALLLELLDNPALESVLIFTRTKHGADRVAKILNKEGVSSAAIHGNKSQNARQRALGEFKEKSIRVLIATDIAARGIDVDHLSHVINYELPDVPETYVHRIGRTGRAGRDGVAYSFCDAEEGVMLKDIEKLIGKSITVTFGKPFSMADVKAATDRKKEAQQENVRRRTEFKRARQARSKDSGEQSRGDSRRKESSRTSGESREGGENRARRSSPSNESRSSRGRSSFRRR